MVQSGKTYHGLKGRYTIGNELGDGGMGVAYEATRHDGKNVAIKCIQTINQEQKLLNPTQIAYVIERLNIEAKVLKSFVGSKPPNIVTYLDQAKDLDDFFIVMERIEGFSLAHIMKSSTLSEKNVIRYSLDILAGLEFIHKHGTVHRDLKPANIMINKNDQCVLIDFGGSKQGHRNIHRPKPTMQGTEQWRCPDQAITGDIHEECDLYSFGRIMFAMLAGCTETQLLTRTTKDGRMDIKLHELRSQISVEMSNLVDEIIDPDHATIRTASQLIKRISSLSSTQKPARIPPDQIIKRNQPVPIPQKNVIKRNPILKRNRAVPMQQHQLVSSIVLKGIEYEIPDGLKGIRIGKLHNHVECYRNNRGCNKPDEGENILVGTTCEDRGCRCDANIAHYISAHHMTIWKDSGGQVSVITRDPVRRSAFFRNGAWTLIIPKTVTPLINKDRVALLYTTMKGPFEDFVFHQS